MKSVSLVVASLIFLLGGIALFGIAGSMIGWQALVFFGGIVCVSIAFAIPLSVLKNGPK